MTTSSKPLDKKDRPEPFYKNPVRGNLTQAELDDLENENARDHTMTYVPPPWWRRILSW